jgi:LuxR family transcriptional regulator, maltose regulon positive regulatory protein
VTGSPSPVRPVDRAIAAIRSSKLRAPTLRLPTVERRRLLELLAARNDARIVLVSASAGYGKSTLAAQWSLACGRPVAWMNLDRGDNDPVVLLDGIAAALHSLGAVDPQLRWELSSVAPRIGDVVLPLLSAELVRLSPFELVLDDAHEITRPRSLEILTFLIEEVPPGSQLVIVTRRDPDVPLTRQRIAGDVIDVRADGLALGVGETQALAESSRTRLPGWSLELIHERTEGWAAAIALALRALHDAPSEDGVALGIHGRQREIADYLLEAVLAREPEPNRRFLLATSVLRRMSAPLCDAILDAGDSGDVLRELERSNSFVIPLDDQRGWYRYHQLFGELLRAELDRRHPGDAARYLARAAAWLQRDGSDPEEAFRCAHEAGDLELAGTIILGAGEALINRGQLETMRLWLTDCSDEEIASEPRLGIAAAWTYALLGEGDKAQRFALGAEHGDLDPPSPDGATSLRSSLANVRATLGFRGVRQMLADGEYVYSTEREAKSPRFVGGCRAIGTANLLLGRPAEASVAFRETLMLLDERPELSYVRLVSLGYLALAAADGGNWSEARRWAREARAVVDEHGLENALPAAVAFTAKTTVLVHDGDFHQAARELARARHLRHLVRGARWLTADTHLRWANLSLDLGERLVAQEHIATARVALHGYPDPGALLPRLGEVEERLARAAEFHLTPAELRIVPFMKTHLSVKEIAARINVSPPTVKTHLARIYGKLGASSRSEAVERVEQLGLEHSGRPREADAPEAQATT